MATTHDNPNDPTDDPGETIEVTDAEALETALRMIEIYSLELDLLK